MEAFDESEVDTVMRTRQTDFYALVVPERICMRGVEGDPSQPQAYHVTVVRLDMPTEMARQLLQKRVVVQGPLSPNAEPDADPPVAMKVAALQAAP